MADVLIFSRDRACQLDALLRSIEENGPKYKSVSVLLKATEPKHLRAYQQVVLASKGVKPFHVETDFHKQVKEWLHGTDRPSFLVDDQIFYRKADLEPVPGVIYQYGLNCVRSHPMGCEQRAHVLNQEDGWFGWSWKDSTGDFAYPLSIGGNVYDKQELLEALPDSFDSPTSLEAGMACYAAWWSRETLTAPLHSCLVSLPHNRVTVQASNPISGVPEWSADALCDAFLDGLRIDYAAMDFSGVDAAHAEVPLVLSKLGGGEAK